MGSAHEHKSGKPQTEYKVAAAFNSLNTLQFHLKASLFEGKRSHMLALILVILLACGVIGLAPSQLLLRQLKALGHDPGAFFWSWWRHGNWVEP